MDQEMEMLRQRIEYLEQRLYECQEQLYALQTRVAELEGRPVAVAMEPEPSAPPVKDPMRGGVMPGAGQGDPSLIVYFPERSRRKP